MTSGSAWIAVFSVATLLAVSGCEEFQTTTSAPESSEALAPGQSRTVMQDVESPDVFSVTETALWDGRPSLGGIWVAHPDVKEPERALIRNPKNGQEIAGALFRRERDNPGPRIQLSSDAAAELGILAGQPTELSIVAVRQEEVIIEGPPVVSEEVIGEDGTPVEGEIEAARVDDSGAEDGAEGVAVAGAAAVGAAAATAEPKRQGFWGRFRDSLRNKPKEPSAANVAAGADAGITEATPVPQVETQTLDPVTSAAAAAIATAEANDKPQARPERAAEAPTPAPASALKNPFVQVGLFSLEENANDAASTLRQAGIVPTVVPGDNRWRVVVGPMASP
ncbi:MAG: SPOR domain-containing protein, partial [Paracoccaceae bacterium]